MAIVVAGTILVLVLVAVLVCMRRQRPGPERSQVVVNPLSAPPQQEQAQALVAALAQSDTALLWSALDSADSPLPPPPVVEGRGAGTGTPAGRCAFRPGIAAAPAAAAAADDGAQ